MKDYNLRLGRFHIHNKEQWDLLKKPLVCIHMSYNEGNGSKRIFCI